jgi:hypothetical protein
VRSLFTRAHRAVGLELLQPRVRIGFLRVLWSFWGVFSRPIANWCREVILLLPSSSKKSIHPLSVTAVSLHHSLRHALPILRTTFRGLLRSDYHCVFHPWILKVVSEAGVSRDFCQCAAQCFLKLHSRVVPGSQASCERCPVVNNGHFGKDAKPAARASSGLCPWVMFVRAASFGWVFLERGKYRICHEPKGTKKNGGREGVFTLRVFESSYVTRLNFLLLTGSLQDWDRCIGKFFCLSLPRGLSFDPVDL